MPLQFRKVGIEFQLWYQDHTHLSLFFSSFSFFLSFYPQVAPGAALLMRILEDFIHLIGEAQKPFQSFLVVTNNLSKSISYQIIIDKTKHSLAFHV